MLDGIKKILDGLQTMNTQEIISDIIHENSKYIIELNQDQLMHGKKMDDTQIGTYANDKYAQMKYQMNAEAGYGNVDLRLKNDFRNDMFVDVRQTVFIVDSGDSKAGELIGKYGDPFGVNPSNSLKFATEITLPRFGIKLEEITGIRI